MLIGFLRAPGVVSQADDLSKADPNHPIAVEAACRRCLPPRRCLGRDTGSGRRGESPSPAASAVAESSRACRSEPETCPASARSCSRRGLARRVGTPAPAAPGGAAALPTPSPCRAGTGAYLPPLEPPSRARYIQFPVLYMNLHNQEISVHPAAEYAPLPSPRFSRQNGLTCCRQGVKLDRKQSTSIGKE